MKRFLTAILLIAACRPAAPPPQKTAPAQTVVRTVDDVDPKPVIYDPPPVLADEAPPPQPKLLPWESPPAQLSPEDEKIRAALPFAPAIAMDPVDGSKVSIRATTPTTEFKNKIYYFSNEANKRAFVANPDQFTKGTYSHL